MRIIGALVSAALVSTAMASTAYAADTINVWMRYGDAERPTIERIIDGFTAETGIKVDLFLANIDFETRLARAAAGGDLPDLIINDATSMGQLQDMGIVKQIDRASVKGGDQLHDIAWQSVEAPDGSYYGVPTSAQAFAVFIRKDWREKLGYDVPKTWDDLYNLAKAFTEDDPDGDGKADTYGYVMPLSSTRGYTAWFMSDLIWQAGGSFLEKQGDGYKASLATPETAKAIDFARKMICDGYAQPAAITSTTGDATPVFSSGQAGIYRSGPYHIAAFVREPGRDKFEVVAPPSGPAGQAELAEGEAAFIMSTSEHAAEAQQFIEYLISPEGQETGMAAGTGDNAIVRLSVNKNVDVTKIQPDPAWGTFADLYGTTARYFPRVPNWKPIRQAASDGLNTILSSCSSDVMSGLEDTDKLIDAELSSQGVLAK
ncbi:sugar ABC transporter substrate-binding protein [Martelella alba]|uniref:Sugar ABC transporter substrate-binding protein n=1 Tax=Martelella alba TaxID=2590451 RepID=A0A506U4I6_9HYPH|nr:sugar ABC transporter substrate-binding protein [Martelella alba]TPW28221.1 sugar ABC transporter substrate-binding protein [Martelella alba]